jgi:hypothetical protein
MKRVVLIDVDGKEKQFEADSDTRTVRALDDPTEWYSFSEVDADPLTLPEVKHTTEPLSDAAASYGEDGDIVG